MPGIFVEDVVAQGLKNRNAKPLSSVDIGQAEVEDECVVVQIFQNDQAHPPVAVINPESL